MSSIRGLWDRLNRAEKHIREFRRTEGEFLATKPYSIELRFHPRRGYFSLWVRVERQPPAELSLILSEAVHQLRSTLDNAACILADRARGCDRNTAMPVCRAAADWAARRTQQQIAKLDPAAAAVVERLQPYHAGDDFHARHHPL